MKVVRETQRGCWKFSAQHTFKNLDQTLDFYFLRVSCSDFLVAPHDAKILATQKTLIY